MAIAGAAMSWLRDSLKILPTYADIGNGCRQQAPIVRTGPISPDRNNPCLPTRTLSDVLASQVPDSAGVYFVPALSGLFAPHWREDARGSVPSQTVPRAVIALLIPGGLRSFFFC